MDRQTYERVKAERLLSAPRPREICAQCRKAKRTCYCELVRPLETGPRFVILIHRDEARRGVATGRMAHLCLTDSLLFEGTDFSANEAINRLLADPAYWPCLLYPSPDAVNISKLAAHERAKFFPRGRRPLIFVIDGTWRTARKMRRLSTNLHALPAIALSPRAPSRFQVRQQPHIDCLSTLEAIHELLDLFSPDAPRPHDRLLEVFQSMVQTQIAFEEKSGRRAKRGLRRAQSTL